MKKSVFDKIARVMMVAMMATVCMTFMTACGGGDDDPLDNPNPVNNNTNNGGNNGSGDDNNNTGGDNTSNTGDADKPSQDGVTWPEVVTTIGTSYDDVIEYMKDKGYMKNADLSKVLVTYSNTEKNINISYIFKQVNGEYLLKTVTIDWNNVSYANALWLKQKAEEVTGVTMVADETDTGYWSYFGSRKVALVYYANTRYASLMIE